MNKVCEICGTEIPHNTGERLILLKHFGSLILNEMWVCSDCYRNYDFTIGAVEWDET